MYGNKLNVHNIKKDAGIFLYKAMEWSSDCDGNKSILLCHFLYALRRRSALGVGVKVYSNAPLPDLCLSLSLSAGTCVGRSRPLQLCSPSLPDPPRRTGSRCSTPDGPSLPEHTPYCFYLSSLFCTKKFPILLIKYCQTQQLEFRNFWLFGV